MQAIKEMPVRPTRRRFRWSLRTMFVVVTAVGICLGWMMAIKTPPYYEDKRSTWEVYPAGQKPKGYFLLGRRLWAWS